MAGGFNINTRRKIVQLPTMTKPAGGGTVTQQLPKTGLLSKVFLNFAVTIAGSLSNENALGVSAAVPRVRLTANSGIDIYNTSMAGYGYILQQMLESEYFAAQGQNQFNTAISATTFNLSMVIPVAMNSRDMLGAIMLQNEQTILTLSVDFLADASVATGATVTCTVTPVLELFTVPVDPADWPPLNVVHQVLEDQQAVAAAGQYVYQWQRGNTYLQVGHGLGIGVSGSDLFSRVQWRVNQSDYIQDTGTLFLDQENRYLRGRARVPGTVLFDLLGTSGLGNYGSTRDLFNSADVTDLATVLTATNSGTLYTVRRQLVMLS